MTIATSVHKSQMAEVITGRRRVGKTELVKQALNDGKDTLVYVLENRQEK